MTTGLAAVHAAATAEPAPANALGIPNVGAGARAGGDLVAQLAEARAAGKAEGVQEGAAAERARVKAIIGSEHAAGREALAAHLAFGTAMAPAEAAAVMQNAPKQAAAAAAGSRLDQLAAAGQLPQPKVTADAPASGQPADDFEAGRQKVAALKGKAAA